MLSTLPLKFIRCAERRMKNKDFPIPEIIYPEVYMSHLREIGDRVTEALKRGAYVKNSRDLDLGQMPKELHSPHFVFSWVSDFNDIICNLNFVLNDLEFLQNYPNILPGSPHKRIQLLTRTFFYEFYRFRELFSQGIQVFGKLNKIPKAEISEARNAFHETFKGEIEMRNFMVHGVIKWGGEYLDLDLAECALGLGYELVERDTGEKFNSHEKLQPILKKKYEFLKELGTGASKSLTNIMEMLAKSFTASAQQGDAPDGKPPVALEKDST